MFAVFKREVGAYFKSPIAYVLIGIFVFISSLLFFFMNMSTSNSEFNETLQNMGIILVFLMPLLTMRILAEDRKNGSEVLLITSPVSLTSVVIGKYLASFFVFFVMALISLIFPIILFAFGTPTLSLMLGGYLGFLLLGAALIAVGLFTSSFTESQIIAAVVAFVISLIMLFISSIADLFGGTIGEIFNWISLLSRNTGFGQGIIEISSVIYYLSFVTVFIFLTIRVIEKRRWSQG
ncbi:MAG: ABC-2 transporter permease [Clostridia bacterium]